MEVPAGFSKYFGFVEGHFEGREAAVDVVLERLQQKRVFDHVAGLSLGDGKGAGVVSLAVQHHSQTGLV